MSAEYWRPSERRLLLEFFNTDNPRHLSCTLCRQKTVRLRLVNDRHEEAMCFRCESSIRPYLKEQK